MKKTICFILALFTIIGLVACNNPEADEEISSEVEVSDETTEEEKDLNLSITVADLSKYVIVRAMKSSDEVGAYAQKLQRSLKEKFSLDINIKSDFVQEGKPMYAEAEYEILLGVCDRDE